MTYLFDDVSRILASPIPRRAALRLVLRTVGSGILGAVGANQLLGAPCPANQCFDVLIGGCVTSCRSIGATAAFCNSGTCDFCTSGQIVCGTVPVQRCCGGSGACCLASGACAVSSGGSCH